MSDKLSDCPFCGSEYTSLNTGGSYYVMCGNCGAEGPWNDDDRDIAIAAWNLRASPAPAISESDLLALLPGTTYMDEPDGGSPSLLEQLQRMAKDATRYRWLRDENRETPDGTRELMAVQYRLPFSDGTDTELFDVALDAAIDAARNEGAA